MFFAPKAHEKSEVRHPVVEIDFETSQTDIENELLGETEKSHHFGAPGPCASAGPDLVTPVFM